MITNINHALEVSQINVSDIQNLVILEDNDNVQFTYKGVPFCMQISSIQLHDKKHYVQDFNNRAEAIEKITGGIKPKTDEDLDFQWSEITYNLGSYEAIQLIAMFTNLWEFHNEIIEVEDKSITFYAYMQEDEKVYSLAEPEQESQKVKLCFNQNAYRIFEGLGDVKINFVASYGYTYASIESENIFLAEQSKEVCKYLGLLKLTPTTEENYELFFDIDFSCTINNGIATFQIGKFSFDYQF